MAVAQMEAASLVDWKCDVFISRAFVECWVLWEGMAPLLLGSYLMYFIKTIWERQETLVGLLWEIHVSLFKGYQGFIKIWKGGYTHKYRTWWIQLQSPWKAGDQSHTASRPPGLVFTTQERAIPSVSPLKRLGEAPPLSGQGRGLCEHPLQDILDILLFSIVNS